MKKTAAFTLLCLFPLVAAAKKPLTPQQEIQRVLHHYHQAKGVTFAVTKKTHNTLLAMKAKTSEGRLFYSKGKLRFEVSKPEKSLLVMDGKYIWFATKLSKDKGGKVLVSRTGASNFKKGSSVMAALLDRGDLFKTFKVDTQVKDGKDLTVSLVALKPDDTEIQTLDLTIDPDHDRLLKVSYSDDRGNETLYEFGSPHFSKALKASLFVYQPPKGAELTEY